MISTANLASTWHMAGPWFQVPNLQQNQFQHASAPQSLKQVLGIHMLPLQVVTCLTLPIQHGHIHLLYQLMNCIIRGQSYVRNIIKWCCNASVFCSLILIRTVWFSSVPGYPCSQEPLNTSYPAGDHQSSLLCCEGATLTHVSKYQPPRISYSSERCSCYEGLPNYGLT